MESERTFVADPACAQQLKIPISGSHSHLQVKKKAQLRQLLDRTSATLISHIARPLFSKLREASRSRLNAQLAIATDFVAPEDGGDIVNVPRPSANTLT